MAVFVISVVWISMVLKTVNGREPDKSDQMTPEKFLATPGEFPYAVVVFHGREMFAGVLVTDDIFLTTCKSLIEVVPQHIPRAMLHTTALTAIGSNGDWKHDINKQKGKIDFVYFGENCLKITKDFQVLLGAAVLQTPFRKTPYVDAVTNRVVIKNTEEWNKVLKKILIDANCYEKVGEVCKQREFVIGGYIADQRFNSQDSPMFRGITHVLKDDACHELICKNISCKEFSLEDLKLKGTLCFPTKGIGGPGSPVAFNRLVVAVGNFVKDDHLIATRFDIGYTLVESLTSAALLITRLNSLLAGTCISSTMTY